MLSREGQAWRIQLLGKLVLHDAGMVECKLPNSRVESLVAYLVLGGDRGHLRTDLSRMIWPQADPDAARASLRNALSQLKALLPQGVLVVTRQEVRLTWPELQIDLRERPLDATPLLPNLRDHWLEPIRERRKKAQVHALVTQAQAALIAGLFDEASSLVLSARSIDSRDGDALRLQTELLKSIGEEQAAQGIQKQAQVRRFVEEGCPIPKADTPKSHPLLDTARWLLDRDPDSALDFVASTSPLWAGLMIDEASAIHQECLQQASNQRSGYHLVEAQYYYILSTGGRLTKKLAKASECYERISKTGEPQAAVKLGTALAYGQLSAGLFDRAFATITKAGKQANGISDPVFKLDFDLHHSILCEHTGRIKASAALLAKSENEVHSTGSPFTRAQYELLCSTDRMSRGQYESAAKGLAYAHEIFSELRADRMVPWVMLSEARLQFALGYFDGAKATLTKIQRLPPSKVGQALATQAEDLLASINHRTGEVRAAALSLAKASAFRRKVGTVRSIAERHLVKGAKEAVRVTLPHQVHREILLLAQEELKKAGWTLD